MPSIESRASLRARSLVCLMLAVCGLGASSAAVAAEISELQVEPLQAELSGTLARFQIVATRVRDGRPVDVTRAAHYTSLTPDICSVNETGRAAPRAVGEGKIRVELDGKSAEIAVAVRDLQTPAAVSFREDVIPVLSKAGCSQGSCHASQYGKGGLKLSVFGFAPDQDHSQLVRERSQRRVSLVRPEDSLFLRKATLAIPHEGGLRFKPDSEEYTLLKAWVEAGVPGLVKDEPEVVALDVTPVEGVYEINDTRQLRVVARYSDGRSRDVTHFAKYDSLGDAVATVDYRGFVKVVGKGQAAVMVRYQGQAKVSHVISPFARNIDLTSFVPNNYIDEKAKSRWQQLGLYPSPVCSDAEFVRRAFLDSIGTLPPPDVAEAFVASSDPEKRVRLVDELLGLTGDPARDRYLNEWSAYWALKWGDLLRNNRKDVGAGGMWSLYNWTRQSLRENLPVDRFVRELITAEGSIFQNGPANYYVIDQKADDLAEVTAQVFLGVRLQCARCHNHPFEAYSQADYYGLAAFFTRVGTKPSLDFGPLGGDSVVKINATGSIAHPRTGQAMSPTPLQGEPIDAAKHRDLRRPLAEWLTSPSNTMFNRNIVNRIWSYYMGTGLVESIDDMRSTNPASNPELLDALAADLVTQGYSLRKLMRSIMTSRVYQLSSTPRPENVADTRFYTHYNLKRLPAEVLLDAVDAATGTKEKFPGVPLSIRAIELPDPNFASYFLDTLGRPARLVACECERTGDPNLAQVLHIANGELIHRKLSDKGGRIARLLQANATDDAAFNELYLVAFSRRPTSDEVAGCRAIVAVAPDRREGLEDVLWALCNSREFLLNH